jgi:transposase-like protein
MEFLKGHHCPKCKSERVIEKDTTPNFARRVWFIFEALVSLFSGTLPSGVQIHYLCESCGHEFKEL